MTGARSAVGNRADQPREPAVRVAGVSGLAGRLAPTAINLMAGTLALPVKGVRGLVLQFGVLDHLHAIPLNDFAFERDRLGGLGGELLIHRLVVADDEVKLVVRRQQADRASALDAFLGTAFMLVALGPVVEVAHHVHDLAFDGLGLATGLRLRAETQRWQRQACAERQGHQRHFQY